jgi:hypothetical protein
MTGFVGSGGVVMWPMAAVALGILWLAARTAAGLRQGASDEEVQRGLFGLLFWGGMSVLLGVLGSVIGFVVMTQAAALAGAVEPRLIWGGVSHSLISLIFGTALFLLAATLWFVLRLWHHRLRT